MHWTGWVQLSAGTTDYSLIHNIWTNSEANPAFYPTRGMASFSGLKLSEYLAVNSHPSGKM
jgi:hypothetical protein